MRICVQWWIYEDRTLDEEQIWSQDITAVLVSNWKLTCLPICNQLLVIAVHCGAINSLSINRQSILSAALAFPFTTSYLISIGFSHSWDRFQTKQHSFDWNTTEREWCLLDDSTAYRGALSLIWCTSISTLNRQLAVESNSSNCNYQPFAKLKLFSSALYFIRLHIWLWIQKAVLRYYRHVLEGFCDASFWQIQW